jgi:hypothetical protein
MYESKSGVLPNKHKAKTNSCVAQNQSFEVFRQSLRQASVTVYKKYGKIVIFCV